MSIYHKAEPSFLIADYSTDKTCLFIPPLCFPFSLYHALLRLATIQTIAPIIMTPARILPNIYQLIGWVGGVGTGDGGAGGGGVGVGGTSACGFVFMVGICSLGVYRYRGDIIGFVLASTGEG